MVQENLKSWSAHILGIVSLVLALTFNPFPALILGIIGLVQSTKQKDAKSKKAKVLNIIAIVVSVAVYTLAILVNLGIISIGNLPLA